MIKLVLLVAAIPVVLISGVHLAVRLLRHFRKHRGEAVELATGLLPMWVSDSIDGWLSDSSPAHSDGGHHGGHDGDHSGHDHGDSGGHHG